MRVALAPDSVAMRRPASSRSNAADMRALSAAEDCDDAAADALRGPGDDGAAIGEVEFHGFSIWSRCGPGLFAPPVLDVVDQGDQPVDGGRRNTRLLAEGRR